MKKNSTLILMGLVMVAVVGVYVFRYMESQKIIKNSTLVQATLVESPGCYASSRTKKTDDKTYYITEVMQHLIVEYQLNGETVKRDMGYVEVGENSTSKGYVTKSEREEDAINMYKYNIGKTFNLYVCNDGNVYIANQVDNAGSEGMLMGIIAGVVVTGVAMFVLVKMKNE